MMLKKRRKKLQGYARRYFSLDYKYGVLNYFASQSNMSLRGSMPIKLCVVSARAKSRDIYIDSGMELWHVKPLNDTDFNTWVAALDVARLGASSYAHQTPMNYYAQNHLVQSEAASKLSVLLSDPRLALPVDTQSKPINATIARQQALDQLTGSATVWDRFDTLVQKLQRTANKAEEASKKQDGKSLNEFPLGRGENVFNASDDQMSRRSSFWKRKSRQPSGTMLDISPTDMPAKLPESPGDISSENISALNISAPSSTDTLKEISLELLVLLEDLKEVVAETKNIEPSPQRQSSVDAASLFSSEEFFDAKENDGVLLFQQDESSEEEEEEEIQEYESNSDVEDDFAGPKAHLPTLSHNMEAMIEESKDHDHACDLYPLPLIKDIPKRRNNIAEAVAAPPNFLTIIRKNVGKDMSSVAMPVTANEPVTILQRFTEILEPVSLINAALTYPEKSPERIIHIAAFASLSIASSRAKERAGRKPFNPLLGETFELVSPEEGVRAITEKVSHRPPIMAMQVDAARWTLQYAPSPHQQIWGKSIEINNKGTARLSVLDSGEVYEWVQPTTFMRNIIAGEKYVEPVGSMSVVCSNGWRAVVEYKAGGMFSGRSEDLRGKVLGPDGKEFAAVSIEGKWTTSISMKTPKGQSTIWKAGPLVHDYQKKFGYTQFAANLNEITPIEKGLMAPTDSRLRPDQRMYENGETTSAEAKKLELEQHQRERRAELEKSHTEYQPVFFEKEGDNWYLKKGKDNYWERRKTGNWTGLIDIFA